MTPQEALSGIFGSISLATWIFLLVCGVMVIRQDDPADDNIGAPVVVEL